MKYITLGKNKLLHHAIIWLLFILSNLILTPSGRPVKQDVVAFTLYYGLLTSTFYFLSLIVFQKLIDTNKILILIIVIALYFVFTTIYYINVNIIYPVFEIESKAYHYTIRTWLVKCFWLYFLICTAAWAFFFNQYNLIKLKEQSKHRKALMLRELNYLKKQFNTHLTFNFFNFCYSEVYQYSETTANAIVSFTDMLGHSLKSTNSKKIPLVDEINYIKNFISIQKLISTGVHASFIVKGNINDITITGRIMSILTERVFFHGIISDPDSPIEIELINDDIKLFFIIRYKNKPRSIELNEYNPGITKVLKVLEIFYENRYSLTFSCCNQMSECKLILKYI